MGKIRELAKRWKLVPLCIGLLIGVAAAMGHLAVELNGAQMGLFSEFGLLRQLDLKVLDNKFRQREIDELPEPQVVIAAIDEAGVEEYGLWPWRRTVMADLLDRLGEANVAAVGFDAVFSDENRDADYVRRLLRSYEAQGLRNDEGLEKSLARLRKQKQQQRKTIRELQEVAANLPRAERAALRQLLSKLDGQESRLDTQFSAVGDRVEARNQAAQEFVGEVEDLITVGSPDEAFADAIARHPQAVLGYFFFRNENEVVGVDEAVLARTWEQTSASALDGAYLDLFSEVDGNNLEALNLPPAIAMRGNLPALARGAKNFGYFNVLPDPDGPIRRIPLLTHYKDKLFPGLSAQTYGVSQGAELFPMRSPFDPAGRLEGMQIGEAFVPTDGTGHMLVNYYTNPVKYFPTYSIADINQGKIPKEDLEGKIVLVGMTAIGLFDLRPTPFEPNTPGVYVHASAIQNMVDGRYLSRPLLTSLWEALSYILVGLLLGLILPRIPALLGGVLVIGGLAAWYWIDLNFFFAQGTWVMFVFPSFLTMGTLLGINLYGYLTEGVEKAKIRRAFQFYMSKDVVDEVLKDPEKLKLGGERRDCSILFSDIRSFTSLSESLTPAELSTLLNRYLTPMTDIVFDNKGTLDKYIGDAIMAIFGAPVKSEHHPLEACEASIAMINRLDSLNDALRAEKLPNLAIGIGVHSGEVSAGNMGSEVRFDYTVIGDNVNLAARLEGQTKQYGASIIVSDTTYQAASTQASSEGGPALVGRSLDVVRVKGKEQPVKIVELFGERQREGHHAEAIETFEAAFAEYQGRQWQSALGKFQDLHQRLIPGDMASQIYIDRCQSLLANPVDRGWDGVFTATSK